MIRYEWVVEADDDIGDLYDVVHWETLTEAKRYAATLPVTFPERINIALVRDTIGDVDENIECRQWAYLEDGKLPTTFKYASGGEGADVPKRFHKETL